MSKITNLQCCLSFMLLNQSMTSYVFFHWFKLSLYLTSLFTACIINLLNLPSSFLAGFISCTDGLFCKFSLWSFSMIKQLLSPLMSMRCSTYLSFRMFVLLMLIFFFMLLFDFLYVEVMELFKKVLYWPLLNLYMLLVLSANVIVLSDLLIIFISSWSFFWNCFFVFLVKARSLVKQSNPFQTVQVCSLFPGILLILVRTIKFDFFFLFPRCSR